MKSIVWKFGIIAVFVILSHCVNDPPSTLHPLLNLELETKNDTSWLIITTTVAEDHSMYQIIDDTCTAEVTYHAIIKGKDSVVIDSPIIANDPEAFKAGTFQGTWVVPDSIILTEKKEDEDTVIIVDTIPYDSARIYVWVLDETERAACASIMVYSDTSLTEKRYQQY